MLHSKISLKAFVFDVKTKYIVPPIIVYTSTINNEYPFPPDNGKTNFKIDKLTAIIIQAKMILVNTFFVVSNEMFKFFLKSTKLITTDMIYATIVAVIEPYTG